MGKKNYCQPKGYFASRKESNLRKCREQRHRDSTTSQTLNASFTPSSSQAPKQSITSSPPAQQPPTETSRQSRDSQSTQNASVQLPAPSDNPVVQEINIPPPPFSMRRYF